jgi:hypothetical protein
VSLDEDEESDLELEEEVQILISVSVSVSIVLGVCSSEVGGASCIRGICNGVPSNSAHPPRIPISTTRCRILESSVFLQKHAT